MRISNENSVLVNGKEEKPEAGTGNSSGCFHAAYCFWLPSSISRRFQRDIKGAAFSCQLESHDCRKRIKVSRVLPRQGRARHILDLLCRISGYISTRVGKDFTNQEFKG